MSSPVLARSDGGHRFYLWGDPLEGYWSVTTIIDGGVPKYLTAWAAKAVSDLVIADLETMRPHSRASTLRHRWTRMGRDYVAALQGAGKLTSIKRAAALEELELISRWLKGQPERIRDSAAELGSDVHSEADALVRSLALESAEAYAAGLALPAWPERLAGHMRSFERFLLERRPRYLATEATVFNRTEAYAGTGDAWMEVDVPLRSLLGLDPHLRLEYAGADVSATLVPRRLIVDYKSGRAIYPTVALQLAAYARAEFIGLPDRVTQVALPAVDGAAVLHLLPAPTKDAPSGYLFRHVAIGDEVFDAFRHAREVYLSLWDKG